MVRVTLSIALACLSGAASARGTVVYAGGAWAAIDRGAVCEAISRSQKVLPKDKVQPVAGISFAADHRRWGEFHARLSRVPRGDASVMLRVSGQPFLLVDARWLGVEPWPRAGAGNHRRVEKRDDDERFGRDGAGVRFSDPYLLDGAPTAIDAAAARCALRGAGKIK